MANTGSSSSTKTTPLHQELKEKNIPDEILEVITEQSLKDKSLLNYKTFLTITLKTHGPFLNGIWFHPNHPYLNILNINRPHKLPKEALCFFWYLFESFTIGMSFNSARLLAYLLECKSGDLPEQQMNTLKLLQWFLPSEKWMQMLSSSPKKHCIVLLKKPSCYIQKGQTGIYRAPSTFIHAWYDMNPSSYYYKINYSEDWMNIRKTMASVNLKKTEDIPPNVLHDEDTWNEDNPEANAWENAIIDYYNEKVFKNQVYEFDIVPPGSTTRSLLDEIPADDPYHLNPPQFTITMYNQPKKA